MVRGYVEQMRLVVAFMRPQIAIQAAAYMLVGTYVSAGAGRLLQPDTLVAALLVALIVSFGFVINDYADIEVDRLTKGYRLLPSGRLTLQQAQYLMAGLVGLIVVTALPAAHLLRSLALCNLALTAAYSLFLKRTVLLGNITLALLNSSIIVFGAIAGGGTLSRVWVIAGVAYMYSLGQEILYTAADVRGDTQAGITTTATYLGVRVSLWLVRGLMLGAAASSTLPLWLGRASVAYMLLLLPCTILPILLYVIPLTFQQRSASLDDACAAVKRIRMLSLLPLCFL
jgi:geranylgeranylglycerol-phosphate geranylgeranyltransferase